MLILKSASSQAAPKLGPIKDSASKGSTRVGPSNGMLCCHRDCKSDIMVHMALHCNAFNLFQASNIILPGRFTLTASHSIHANWTDCILFMYTCVLVCSHLTAWAKDFNSKQFIYRTVGYPSDQSVVVLQPTVHRCSNGLHCTRPSSYNTDIHMLAEKIK